jgi:hypothetical protein
MTTGVSKSSRAAMEPPVAAPELVRTGQGHQAQLEQGRDSDQLIRVILLPHLG